MMERVRKLTILRSWMDLYENVKDTPVINDELFGYFHYFQGTLDVINPSTMFKHIKRDFVNNESKSDIDRGLTIFAHMCIVTNIGNKIQYFLNQWSKYENGYINLPLEVMTVIRDLNTYIYNSPLSLRDRNAKIELDKLLSVTKLNAFKQQDPIYNNDVIPIVQRDLIIIKEACEKLHNRFIFRNNDYLIEYGHLSEIKLRKASLFVLLESMLYIDCLLSQCDPEKVSENVIKCQKDTDPNRNPFRISDISLLAAPRPDFHFLNILTNDSSPEMSHKGFVYLNCYMRCTAANYV